MNHNTIELPQSYYDNPQEYKRNMIKGWKQKGVIYEEWDDLYEVYMNTMKCQHCNKPFETSRQRCLDHNHETGLFRMILCQGCNVRDSHLKYSPETTTLEKRIQRDKAGYDKNRDKILEQKKEYHQKNKEVKNEKSKVYYQANKEKINLRRKAQRLAKKEKLKENNLNK